MIDVRFNEAMEPLVEAMDDAHLSGGNPVVNGRKMAAAVVEALGIPAQMVADPEFRACLKGLVKAHTYLPPIRPDEPEAITEPDGRLST